MLIGSSLAHSISEGHMVYILNVTLLSIGFYGLISSSNLFKKLMSLAIMQTSVILLYVCIGYRGSQAVAPVYRETAALYTNPLPQVLMLTAIVVGLAINAVGLALIIKLNQHFNSTNSNTIDKQCHYDRLYSVSKPYVRKTQINKKI